MEALQRSEEDLWADRARGVTEAREQLIQQYLPLAKRLAASLYATRAVQDVEFGDYLHLAYVGLLEAMQRYRAGGEAQFATFATYRIRGTILNNIPRMTETGDRLSHIRRARRDRAASLLENEGKPEKPSVSSLVDVIVGLALSVQLDEIAETEPAEATPFNDPYASQEYADLQRRLRDVLTQLPEREARLVDYHYFQHVGFDEIAEILGVTKGRVSQLHKRALERVRELMKQRRLDELR
jgi:RNA polymerase sigma factor for flagellar operon FliA